MRLVLISLVGVAAAGTAIAAQKSTSPEPYFGQRDSICPIPDTVGANATGSDAKVPSPVTATAAKLIDSYVAAVTSGKSGEDFVDTVQVPGKTRSSCAAALRKLASSGRCKSNPLYQLSDGEIRQAWLCDGKLTYNLFYTVEGGKLTNVWSRDATRPVKVIACSDPSKSTGDAVWNGSAYVLRCSD